MKQKKEVAIDGRYGEGGGQILRTALTLSAIFKVPLHINHIRGNRKKPGLRPQHLTAVNALTTITGAKVEGAKVDSGGLVFEPGEIKGRKLPLSHRHCWFNRIGNADHDSSLALWKNPLSNSDHWRYPCSLESIFSLP